MQSPRASAASRIAGPTITQPAFESASCCAYLGLERKLIEPGEAASRGAISSIGRCGSPCNSPPSAWTMVPRRCGTSRLPYGVERPDHHVGDVVLRVDVHGLLQDDVVLLLLGDLLDHAIGAVEDLLQLLVLAGVEVFLELAAFVLEIVVGVDELLLALRALALGQGGGLALETV